MKLLSTISLAFLISGYIAITSIHEFSVSKAEGGQQSLSAYQGKKILVITLPIQQSASADSLLYSLDTLASAHSSTLVVIAVPAYEDGFIDSMKIDLLQWYRSKLGNQIVITDGCHTRKTSGTQQHPLFKWLTQTSQNGVFDIDVEGPGSKFFANIDGKLYGVLRPQIKVSGRLVQKTLQLQ